MSSWQQSLGIMDPSSITHEVAGKAQKFYCISGTALGKIKPVMDKLGEVISAAITVMTTSDAPESSKQIQDPEDGFFLERARGATPVETVRYKHDLRKEAVGNFLDMALSADTQEAMALIIMDSMKEVFSRTENGDPKAWPSPSQFIEQTPADSVIQAFTGAVLASRDIFGPFAKNLEKIYQTLQVKIERALEEESEVESETSSMNLNDPTFGSQAEEGTEPSES